MATEKLVAATSINDALLRWVIEHGNQGLIVTDEALRIRGWNHWLEAKTGRKAATVLGCLLLEEFPEIKERRLDVYFTQALAGQSNVLSQKLHKFLLDVPSVHRLGKQPMHQSIQISPLMGASAVIGTVTIIEDVTERVNREAELQRQLEERAALLVSESSARSAAESANTRLRNLQAITDQAFAQLSLNDVLAKIVLGVRTFVPSAITIILLAEDSGDLTIRAVDGMEPAKVLGVRIPRTASSSGTVAPDGSARSVLESLPPGPLSEALASHGIKSLISYPLIIENRLLGELQVGITEAGAPADDDARFLRLVGDRLAIAIERARLFEGERKARSQAEIANRLKDQFLATVSHELRTPLNAILGWARLLTSKRIDADTATHAAEVIERNARAQAQLIDDLLDVSRIISGKLRLNLSLVEPVAIVEAALDGVRPAADAKGIHLTANFDPQLAPVSGDPDRIQQIIWNLLSNAIKFTPAGGSVTIEMHRTRASLEISVSDTGQGIKQEFLPFVFDRFRQAEATVTRTHSGLGLGLAIVRHLVELHGGTVHASSEGEGKGATFKVEFPMMGVVREVESAIPEQTKEPEDVLTNTAFDCTQPIAGIRIVLVDDAPDSLDLLSTVLQQCGAEVKTASSAADGLSAVTDFKPDVLISDIEMPREDGYSFMRKVRALASDDGGDVAAVALTAHAKAEDRVRALSAGFNIHVPKPVEPAELLVAVQSLTERILKTRQRATPEQPASGN